MKKPLTLFFVLSSALLLSSSPAFAVYRPQISPTQEQIEAKSALKEEKRNKTKERIETVKTKSAEKIEEAKQKQLENRAEFAHRHAERLNNRFIELYYNKLADVIARVETKLAAMMAEGKDVSASQAKIAEAKVQLELAKSLAEKTVAKFQAVTAEDVETQKTTALEAKNLANQARDTYKKSLDLIKEAVSLAKLHQKND